MGQHATALQKAKIIERNNGLRRRVTSWCDIQSLYIPGTTLLRALDAQHRPVDAPEIKVYELELWLPSSIGRKVTCDQSLRECEWDLREAQANDALHTLRQNLRLDSFLTKRKKDWSRGVRQNTRSQTIIQQNLSKVKAGVEKYRVAQAALVILEPLLGKPARWAESLRPLADEDIRGMPATGLGEGSRTLSWIWMSPGVLGDGGEQGLNDGMFHSNIIWK